MKFKRESEALDPLVPTKGPFSRFSCFGPRGPRKQWRQKASRHAGGAAHLCEAACGVYGSFGLRFSEVMKNTTFENKSGDSVRGFMRFTSPKQTRGNSVAPPPPPRFAPHPPSCIRRGPQKNIGARRHRGTQVVQHISAKPPVVFMVFGPWVLANPSRGVQRAHAQCARSTRTVYKQHVAKMVKIEKASAGTPFRPRNRTIVRDGVEGGTCTVCEQHTHSVQTAHGQDGQD